MHHHEALLAILGVPGGWEWLIILIVALLIFGKRLPEVARNMGKGIVEFKKGVKGVEDEVEEQSEQPGPPPQVHSPPSDAGDGAPDSSPSTPPANS